MKFFTLFILFYVTINTNVSHSSQYDNWFEDGKELTNQMTGLHDRYSQRQIKKLPPYKRKFCKRNEFDIADKLIFSKNRMAFINGTSFGLLNGGVCWWHSLFTRNATYLAHFLPEKQKPNYYQAIQLIKNIMAGKEVVEIGGFNNLKNFSEQYEKEIIETLESQQIHDGLFKGGLIDGITGTVHGSAKELQIKMDTLYSRMLARKKLVFQVLQMEGITAHAWLVIDIQPKRSKQNPLLKVGYDLKVLDSNFNFPMHYQYHYGMKHFKFIATGKTFFPKNLYEGDHHIILKALDNYCIK